MHALLAASTARTRDRQFYHCSKAPLHQFEQINVSKCVKHRGIKAEIDIANHLYSDWREELYWLDSHCQKAQSPPTQSF